MYIFSSNTVLAAFSACVLLCTAASSIQQGHSIAAADVVSRREASLPYESDIFRPVQGQRHVQDTSNVTTDTEDDHDEDEDEHGEDEHDEDEHSESESKPWGTVIIASLIINLSTLSGVVLVGGHWVRKLICPNFRANPAVGNLWVEVIIPMFASGALMATTFFLLLPEALHLIAAELSGGGHDEHGHRRYSRFLEGDDNDGEEYSEVDATWRWGASIMGGFLFPVVLHAFFPHDQHHHAHGDTACFDEECCDAEEQPQQEQPKDPDTLASNNDETTTTTSVNNNIVVAETKTKEVEDEDEDGYTTICGCIRLKELRLFFSMNLGEMLHNFTDGIFVGAAYLGCGTEMGNTVLLVTILHEIPNQLAGYLIMVNQNGINPFVALALNFLFGLSILAGGLLVLTLDFSQVTIGCIFAIGGGIFLHVAISEMLGNAERNVKKPIHMLYVLLAFLFGAVLIGLVLIDHQHCGGH